MPDYRNDNRRIARNTLIIYINLFLNMAIGLISSRLVLQALGVSDYGLYNVAGGVALLFTFISNALSSTTFRFVNVEMGKKDGGDINRVFNVCRVLHIAIAVILFLILEIGGIWYIYHHLNVEPGKEADALFVFQVATIVMALGVMNVPYSSLFNATEKFFFSAVVTLTGKLIEFALVIWLLGYGGNRLRAYSVIMISSTVIPFIVYHIAAYRKWPSYVRWKLVSGWRNYKEVIAFSNYNLLSGVASVARSQGSALLINFFFGTAVNGAFAVAKSMERHVFSFSNRFQDAAGPQITQNYTNGRLERVYYLSSKIGKYSMLMFLLAFFPLWAEMEFVLDVWLTEVPEGALMFCRMILLLIFVSTTCGGIWQVINASGKVAWFRAVYSFLTVSCIPVGFFVLKAGSPAYILLALFVAADVIYRIIELWMAHRILHFPSLHFCRDAYLPVAKVAVLMVPILVLTSFIPWDSPLWSFGRLLLIVFLTAGAEYFVGLDKGERERVLSQIKRKLPCRTR